MLDDIVRHSRKLERSVANFITVALEDRISALTTKDPNKLKVYTDGYCGHCLRSFSYFGDQMPDIIPDDVSSINSIAKAYPNLRQDSKAPTFLLTYGGTHYGLMYNCGFSETMAKQIESKYHQLYVVSDQWVEQKIEQACIDGYVTVAFGLRVRTPVLAKTTLNNKATPYEAKKEARTAGNALGQSWGLLNNRAAIEYRTRLMASEHRLNVLPIMQIHDAQYHLLKVDLELLKWHNDNLIECMEWQELPDIQHDQVKLGGELSVFYPTWADETKLPNKADLKTIKEILS
jgi:DNA polymerase-1